MKICLDSLINIYIKHLYYDSAYYVEQRYTNKKQDGLVKTAVLYSKLLLLKYIDSLPEIYSFTIKKHAPLMRGLVEKNPSRYDFKTRSWRVVNRYR